MATGQEISNVQQIGYFYNVNGLIERDKNIYYVPFVEDLLLQEEDNVCDAFFKLFNSVCTPPSTDYVSVPLTRWSPEDRTLSIKGTVDNFRKGSIGGLCLNYLVVKRIVNNVTYYVGFFISDYVQTGANTVRLSLVPDYFTNLFYWSSVKVLTNNFDPFNSVMKNNLVERQHYNRVKVSSVYDFDNGEHPLLIVANQKLFFSNLISDYPGRTDASIRSRVPRNDIHYEVIDRTTNNIIKEGDCCSISLNGDNATVDFIDRNHNLVYFFDISDVETNNLAVSFICNTSYQPIDRDVLRIFNGITYIVPERYQITDIDNMEKFVNTDETYYYRQLFKDSRVPVNFVKVDEEDNIINNVPAEAFACKTKSEAQALLYSWSREDRYDKIRAVANACIRYLNIITKDPITYPMIIEGQKQSEGQALRTVYYQARYTKDYEVDNSFPSASQHIVIPFLAEVKGLEVFKEVFDKETAEALGGGIRIYGEYKGRTVQINNYGSYGFSEILSRLNDIYGYYIQSMFVTPYSELSSKMTFNQFTSSDFEIWFIGNLVNSDTPVTPNIKEKRKGTWWSGYRYEEILTPTKLISDYDNLVVEEPTIVLLPYEFVELNSEQTEFKNQPVVSFTLGGEVDSPTSLTRSSTFFEYILGIGFLVGRKGFENRLLTGEVKRNCLSLDYVINSSTLISNYYEPVLEMEPYNFYSLSIGEIETVIDRKRYYQMKSVLSTSTNLKVSYKVPVFYNQAVNTQVKLGAIPVYTINEIEQRYYTEELMFITTSGVTIHVDSYAEFMYVMSPQLRTQSSLARYNAQMDVLKSVVGAVGSTVAGGVAKGEAGAVSGAVRGFADVINQVITSEQNIYNVLQTQKAQKASAGAKADTFHNSGSDYIYELNLDEYCIMLNHYSIDIPSYNSVAKTLERYGYLVRLYDILNVYNRKGWNFIKLSSFDFVEDEIKLTEEQSSAVERIFSEGVTLLHNKEMLHNGSHNYEKELDLI